VIDDLNDAAKAAHEAAIHAQEAAEAAYKNARILELDARIVFGEMVFLLIVVVLLIIEIRWDIADKFTNWWRLRKLSRELLRKRERRAGSKGGGG
jgi:hypothetical protein